MRKMKKPNEKHEKKNKMINMRSKPNGKGE